VIALSEEPKGIFSNNHELLERKDWKRTKRGIIIFKGKGDQWYLDFPDDSERIDCNTIELMNFIYYLEKTRRNLDKSHRLTWK
jgi:hypothetical protein